MGHIQQQGQGWTSWLILLMHIERKSECFLHEDAWSSWEPLICYFFFPRSPSLARFFLRMPIQCTVSECIVNVSVFDALLIGSGPVAAALVLINGIHQLLINYNSKKATNQMIPRTLLSTNYCVIVSTVGVTSRMRYLTRDMPSQLLEDLMQMVEFNTAERQSQSKKKRDHSWLNM